MTDSRKRAKRTSGPSSKNTKNTFCVPLPLNFEATPTRILPWQSSDENSADQKCHSISEMVEDIIKYKKIWEEYRKNGYDSHKVQKIQNEFTLNFIHHLNVGEEVGTQTVEETRQVLSDRNITFRRSTSKSEAETLNIEKALKHLNSIANQAECDENYSKNQLLGLLELQDCILELHKILLYGIESHSTLPDNEKTKPGRFSTNRRVSDYKGKTHEFPFFETESDAEICVQTLIDDYNVFIDKIKKCDDESDRIYSLFKCASWFFFQLISLHPFSDGNGRLCRLLCNYVLSVETPFPVSIYNIFSKSTKDNYVEAIESARNSGAQHPQDLAAMLIECGWLSWRKFIEKLTANK